MASYDILKNNVKNVIKQNGNGEITGDLLQQILLTMIGTLGSDFQFAGVAVPATNPPTSDSRVFYLAGESGTYSNFTGIVLDKELAVIIQDGDAWQKVTLLDSVITKADLPTKLSQLSDDATHRLVTDAQITNWNNKQASGDYALKSDIPTQLSQLAEDATHMVVTAEEIKSWNGKQPSGNYALKSELPTRLAQLTGDNDHMVVTNQEKDYWDSKADTITVPTKLSQLTGDSSHRVVTDAQIISWNNKQPKGDYALKSEIPTELYQLNEDDQHLTVTRTEKGKWNAKQNAGDYALKSDLPTKLSQLAGDDAHLLVNIQEKDYWNAKADAISIPTKLSQLAGDATHRVVTDSEKAYWNAKYDSTNANRGDVNWTAKQFYGRMDTNQIIDVPLSGRTQEQLNAIFAQGKPVIPLGDVIRYYGEKLRMDSGVHDCAVHLLHSQDYAGQIGGNTWAGGMDIWNNKAFIGFDGGHYIILNLANYALLYYGTLQNPGSSVSNHTNNCCFYRNHYYDSKSAGPLLYTSQAGGFVYQGGVLTENNNACFVYDITAFNDTPIWVQTIKYEGNEYPKDKKEQRGDWVLDSVEGYIYFHSSITKETSGIIVPNGRVTQKILKFKIPAHPSRDTIILHDSDILDRYEWEQPKAYQGCQIIGGIMYMLSTTVPGYGADKEYEILQVHNLHTHSKMSEVDLTRYGKELEGISLYNNKIYINMHKRDYNNADVNLYEINNL